ncbi:hypothetical protein ACQKL5_07990 [Peribacillus sp. NPDC097675]|uniref:hypothetical protein n=1 Tax=Peribacillus sp. NPDC097675 TaxID=3390618 RepID=UPI003D00973B
MSNGTWFASDSLYVLLTLFPIIIYLVLTGFAIYFVIRVIKFMNEKIILDRERNEKIDELIKFNQGIKD